MKLSRKDDRTRAALLPPSFSTTERRVGLLVGAGHADQAIAARLLLSVQTVEWTVAKLCRTLGVRSRDELVVLLAELSGP
jgi:DNA-binding CsgD family transcriptional regulator